MAWFCLNSQNILSAESKQTSRVDILIFSPHPDDETIACAGVILKAIQDNKAIKVIFLTNGDAFIAQCAAWFNKKPEELAAQDYISFGQERCNEAQNAAKRLSLSPGDEIFLSFPDKGLLPLWEEKYNTLYMSETTKTFSCPYKFAFNRAKKGYSRRNLLMDIKDILGKYKPRKIYMPHPLDTNKDHRAAAYFINCALAQLKKEEGASWLDGLEVSEYLIHSFNNNKPNNSTDFSQTANSKINIGPFKRQKKEALNEYRTQFSGIEEEGFLNTLIKAEEEIFWDIPKDKQDYLNQLEEEWLGIAELMRQEGFNINFGPVVDVAEEIEDRQIQLVKRQRIYSQNPGDVIDLAGSVIEGLNKAGVTPVLKHFPGLGAVRLDTHLRLPTLEKAQKSFYNEDLMPFKSLIAKCPHLWVMTGHAIYPFLSDKPASLSYEIQTNLLRKELGFTGVIISDELLNMQSILEFANREKIPEPFIGEIIVRVFQAGTDIALIYPPPKEAEGIIYHIIQSVMHAVKKSRLKEEEIDTSVKRVLKEKERVFSRPLLHLLKDMPLEEKICQKIAVDIYQDAKLLSKYNLCAVRPSVKLDVNGLQHQSKIPMFIFAQHEGGEVNDHLLRVSTRSAYVAGKEFERLGDKNVPKNSSGLLREHHPKIPSVTRSEKQFNFPIAAVGGNKHEESISSLLDSMDKLIELFPDLLQKGRIRHSNVNYLTPLSINSDNSFELKPFNQLPFIWLRSFPDEHRARYAYEIFKNIYQKWIKTCGSSTPQKKRVISGLISLRKSIEKSRGKEEDKSNIRVLCLAAHPDDEDGEALAYFGKKFNCQTYILAATRGEAGENAVNSCFYEDLGALRVEEMEKSAEVLGVKKVYYLGKKDFGYSIGPDEAFKKWGRQDTLEKLVYFIRLIRPHIIITKHNKTSPYEHGQHQAISILAEEAFDLAGNPEMYPEMVKTGLPVWQPVKFYQRTIGRDAVSPFDIKPVILDTQELVDSKNKNYRQIAREAFNQHKSQHYFLRPGGFNEDKLLYQLVKAKAPSSIEESFFDWVKADDPSAQGGNHVSPSGLPGVNAVNNLRIGLVEKNNNIMFVALKTLGHDFKSLDKEYLMNGDLSHFDTIILGQGAYTFYEGLDKANSRLLEFIKKGGNLIVFTQYSGAQFAAPYPLKIVSKPGNDEDAPIEILVFWHPLFNFPNLIDSHDFSGWVQDRGLFFADGYSDKYTELTKCFSSQGLWIKGGYLITDYGKGSYIYAGYAWYRQFREFHLGAYKNLSNMLAYPFAKKSNEYN